MTIATLYGSHARLILRAAVRSPASRWNELQNGEWRDGKRRTRAKRYR